MIRFALALVEDDAFLAEFEPLAAEVAQAGARSALAQLVLRFTCPGVPDIYAGDELPFLALVDPDNRRPVNLAVRRRVLERAGPVAGQGARKPWAIRELLALRARRPESFAGSYEPLEAAPGTCAFRRGEDVLVAVSFRGGRPELDAPGPPAGTTSWAASIRCRPARRRPSTSEDRGSPAAEMNRRPASGGSLVISCALTQIRSLFRNQIAFGISGREA